MLGQKTFAPKLFYQFSLEERVPEEHLLRRVAAVVDFGFVRRLTARFYSHTGQPGIDPKEIWCACSPRTGATKRGSLTMPWSDCGAGSQHQ